MRQFARSALVVAFAMLAIATSAKAQQVPAGDGASGQFGSLIGRYVDQTKMDGPQITISNIDRNGNISGTVQGWTIDGQYPNQTPRRWSVVFGPERAARAYLSQGQVVIKFAQGTYVLTENDTGLSGYFYGKDPSHTGSRIFQKSF